MLSGERHEPQLPFLSPSDFVFRFPHGHDDSSVREKPTVNIFQKNDSTVERLNKENDDVPVFCKRAGCSLPHCALAGRRWRRVRPRGNPRPSDTKKRPVISHRALISFWRPQADLNRR